MGFYRLQFNDLKYIVREPLPFVTRPGCVLGWAAEMSVR